MKKYLDKYDSDMLADIVNSLHARIQSDATNPSPKTIILFDELKTDIKAISDKLDTHILKEEVDSKSIFSFIEEMKPILERFKNSQGFWSVINAKGKSIIFLSSVLAASGAFFFSLKWVIIKVIEHGF